MDNDLHVGSRCKVACARKKEILFRKVKWTQRIVCESFEVKVVVVGKHDDMSRHSCVHGLRERRGALAR